MQGTEKLCDCINIRQVNRRRTEEKKNIRKPKLYFCNFFPPAMWMNDSFVFTFAIFFSIRTRRKKLKWKIKICMFSGCIFEGKTIGCVATHIQWCRRSEDRKVDDEKSGNQIVWIDNDGWKWAIHLSPTLTHSILCSFHFFLTHMQLKILPHRIWNMDLIWIKMKNCMFFRLSIVCTSTNVAIESRLLDSWAIWICQKHITLEQNRKPKVIVWPY